MSQPRASAPPGLPTWLVVLGSLAIVVHLIAVGICALSTPSGPWWTPMMGLSTAEPPQFASTIRNQFALSYLRPLRLQGPTRFRNYPREYDVYLEITLKDEDGAEIRKVTVPDPEANFWVRHRQQRLAQALTMDRPVPPPGTEPIAGPGQKLPTRDIWDFDGGPGRLRVRTVPVHMVPRDRNVMRPSEMGMALARSYVRHLCRKYDAASGELVRYTREAVGPEVLFAPEVSADTFSTLVSNFGEFSR